jgi:IstB-like ATP binding protein
VLEDIEALRRIADARGIDLAKLAAADPSPVMNPDGWIMDDPIGWRVETAQQILATVIPRGFAKAELSELGADQPGTATPDWVRQLWNWFDEYERDPYRRPFLIMSGFPGSGKTHCAWAMIKAMVMAGAHQGRRVDFQFVTHPDLNNELRPKPDSSHAWAADKYLNTQVLVLDDLGAGKISDFTVESTLRIINYRYDQGLTTIFTTNEKDSDLLQMLSERVYSRVYSGEDVIVEGGDRRLQT